jgi:hypothetical protein
MNQGVNAHTDPSLNLLRLVAFGALGFYLYKVQKKQGNLQGFNASNPSWVPSPERIIDTVMPWVDLDQEHKQIISLAGKNLLRGLFEAKGIIK